MLLIFVLAIYVGCFKDDTDRMYDFPIEKKKEGWIDGSMTINKCTEYCKFHKYIYSGLQVWYKLID